MSYKTLDIVVTIVIILLLFLAIFSFVLDVDAELVTLSWDPPQQEIAGVRIYQKTAKEGDAYNYDAPIADVLAPLNSATIEVLGEENAVLKYQWVARAYRDDIESTNSNEVSYKVVNIPPLTPIGLSAQYADDVIRLTWEQPTDSHFISHWLIYYKRDDGEFIPLGQVNDGNELELTADVTNIAPAEETTELTFVVVAYRSSGVYSANSVETTLTINRESIEPIQNLKIEVNIPL